MGKDSALIPVKNGTYDYAWVDPNDPRAREVKPVEVVDKVGELDGSTWIGENLLIVGESGDALRSLGTIPEYAEKYLGKVKLVYIDPPFNTGQTFEHYADQMEHSIWLTMMRDRIRAIKPLMAPDSSIWVHLDDAEVHRMRVLMDEQFGAENFVAEVVWVKADSPNNSARYLSKDTDLILLYALDKAGWSPRRLPRSAAADAFYSNPDNDPRGSWYPGDPYANKPYSLGLYSIIGPTGRTFSPPPGRYWRVSEQTFRALEGDGRIWWGPERNARPSIKRFLNEMDGLTPRTLWHHEDVGSNRTSKNEMRALFPGVASFATPKPERLIQRILQIGSQPGDVVLDCFAGSGTTAAVAHKMGRRWVTVELQESTAETFIVPRLTKVVRGEDPGGITAKTERVAVGELPDGITPEEAQQFTSLIGKVTKSVDGLDPSTIKALKAATRTRNETTLTWTGGGGFTVARMGPSMYDVDDEDGTVYLSEHATNGAWSKAIAGQLKFTLTPDNPVFCGVRRRQRLAVIDGVVDEIVVRTIVESLGEAETALVVGKAVIPAAGALLADLSPGSRIRKAPDDLFPKSTVK